MCICVHTYWTLIHKELIINQNMKYKYFKSVFDFQLNSTDIKPIYIHGTLDDPLIQKDFTLHIIIPVICVVILILAVLTALLLRRRRNIYSRTPKLDSPVAFIHKQVCEKCID